jgi:Replication initiator protein, pSAM2
VAPVHHVPARHLARRLGITQKRLRALVRIRYVKVAEYQARGVVHFHAVIRLDGPGEDYQPPPPGIDAAMLCDAVRTAAAAVRIAQPDGTGTAITLSFGAPQGTDVRPIRRDDLTGTGQPLNHQAVANYIAKYATKTLTVPGLPAQRLQHQADIEHLRCPGHQKRMITTAWQLGSRRQTGDPRFRQWAHMLGYGGHFLTKSCRYSVTFGQLRKARTDHRRAERHPAANATPGAAPSTRPSSWLSRPGPTPEPATAPPPTPSSRSPPQPAHASTKTMPHDNQPTKGER